MSISRRKWPWKSNVGVWTYRNYEIKDGKAKQTKIYYQNFKKITHLWVLGNLNLRDYANVKMILDC